VMGERQAAEPAPPTPIWISERLRNLLLVGAILALGVAVWRVPGILPIVLGGATLALILSFPVRWLAHVLPRGVAVLLTLLLVPG
jgi:predicted PurR-regulated permease PerM